MQKYLKTVAFILILVWAVVALKTLEIENKNRIINNVNIKVSDSIYSFNLKETIINTLPKTVPLLITHDKAYSSCSGVVLENTSSQAVVLTAKHCTKQFKRIYADTIMSNKIVSSDKYDLALLIIPYELPGKSIVTLAETDVNEHDPIYIIGYPLLETFLEAGEILMMDRGLRVTHMKAVGGCSGGGVFNTKGDLIGILVEGLGDTRITFIEPLDHIKDFLRVK